MCSRSTQYEPGNRDPPEIRHPTYNPQQQSRHYPGGAYTNNHLQNLYYML